MTYKLVALDVDGTVRTQKHPITDRTRRAIAAVAAAGATVTIATGRSYKSAVHQSRDLGITAPIVSFQGAHLADPSTNEVLWHQPLTPGLARLALDAIEGNGFTGDVMAYYGHEIYVKAITPWVDAYSGRNEVVVNEVGDLTRIADLGPTRFVAVGDPGEIETLETRLLGAHDSSLHITRSLAHFCEVLHPDGGKDKALAQLCNRLAVKPDEVVAIGNGWNDVHMLRWAGLGIATADAVKEALAAADRIARPVEEDGVAKVLEGLLAQGLFS